MQSMPETITGLLKLGRRGEGELRDPAQSFRAGRNDARVPRALIRKYALPEGAWIEGSAKRLGRQAELTGITTISGLSPEEFTQRTTLKNITAVDPVDRFKLATGGDLSMRVVDLVAPIGRGTRSLIVSPPKAGKTTLLISMAKAIRMADPEIRIIALLVDERPEEVTHFRRGVDAEVLASSKDHSPSEHVELSRLALAHVQTELECGREIVLLVDSLTRIGRAFNVLGSGTGRTMSGGLEAGVMEVPRRLFGLARNAEGGGSVTIIATVLVDTGSRMDELIFQEFKGTGNSEVVLNRSLAEARIFPAIDLPASGTRKEELLLTAEELTKIAVLRQALGKRKPPAAMKALIQSLSQFPTNEAFLDNIPMP